ncbi:MAG: thermonuclease family protein [Peptostreptococcaceae bacterium]
MKFFKLKKNIILSIIASLSIIVAGCSSSDTNNSQELSENISVSSTFIEHSSHIKNPISPDKLDNSVIKATVDRVVDGDTVEIILPNGEEVDTRLLLIDTPETKHPKLGVQKFGPEASEFAKSVLSQGDTVYFELDKGAKTDKYNRYLGYLWYTCDTHNTLEMYNERVVEEGLARVGYIYDQTKHLDALLDTEEIAKDNKVNIWSINGYVTDEGYDMSKVDSSVKNTDSNKDTKPDQSNNSNSSNNLVYANGGNSSSNFYHKERTSHGMKGAIKMNEDKALKEGYEPCSSCFN